MRHWLVAPLALSFCLPVYSQQSEHFKVEASTFNAGGRPDAGQTAESANFRVSLDALGQGLAAPALASASFGSSSGFPASHLPPGQVANLVFHDTVTLDWTAHPSAGSYSIYRDSVGVLTGGMYGVCEQTEIAGSGATDIQVPGPSDVWFYLVTVSNSLGEEGALGPGAGGVERPNTGPCP